MDTLQFVRAQLDSSERTMREIADGAGVGQSWLRMFARGEIPDPGYSKVKLLADYFMRVGVTPAQAPQQAAWDGGERRHHQMRG